MKLRKGLAILAIVGAAGLFAATDMSSVSTLVDQINKTTNIEEKNALLQKLHDKLIAMDKDDLPAAQDYVSEKLKMTQKAQ
jgi:hypothetical protein